MAYKYTLLSEVMLKVTFIYTTRLSQTKNNQNQRREENRTKFYNEALPCIYSTIYDNWAIKTIGFFIHVCSDLDYIFFDG